MYHGLRSEYLRQLTEADRRLAEIDVWRGTLDAEYDALEGYASRLACLLNELDEAHAYYESNPMKTPDTEECCLYHEKD